MTFSLTFALHFKGFNNANLFRKIYTYDVLTENELIYLQNIQIGVKNLI